MVVANSYQKQHPASIYNFCALNGYKMYFQQRLLKFAWMKRGCYILKNVLFSVYSLRNYLGIDFKDHFLEITIFDSQFSINGFQCIFGAIVKAA